MITNKEYEIIKDNLDAYKANFGYISIEKRGKSFYVFTDEKRKADSNWTNVCDNIHYLNGWLYGAVQAANGIMKPIEELEEVIAEIDPIEGYLWEDHDDGSGHIVAPDGKFYFSYDMGPYTNIGGIEYTINDGHNWGVFEGSLEQFKQFAENTLRKMALA